MYGKDACLAAAAAISSALPADALRTRVEHAMQGPARGLGQARPIRTESTGGR
jgi:hypothetical protein